MALNREDESAVTLISGLRQRALTPDASAALLDALEVAVDAVRPRYEPMSEYSQLEAIREIRQLLERASG